MAKSATRSRHIVAVVLKFKDKGTEDTISAHQQIINTNEHHYVWWGWWSKDFENLPNNQLREIRNNIDDIEFYLFHTKKETLYKATCKEIMYRDNADGMSEFSCPDCYSPDYYKEYPTRAWFRFTEIHETSSDDFLMKYSFLEDDLIDEDHKEKFSLSSFPGCQASNLELFSVQKRTVWFLGKRRKTDASLPRFFSPTAIFENVSKGYYKSSGTKILILSDLHFSDQHHAFSLGSDITKMRLIDVIKKKLNGIEKNIGGIIISGDLSWRADSQEFAYAEQFILELMELYNVRRDQVLIVPGNHDIAFQRNPPEKTLENTAVEVATKEAQANYIDFYNNILHMRPKEDFLCASRKILLQNNLPLEIIGLDSNMLQQHENSFVGQGFVGPTQLNYLSTQMELKEGESDYSYRILVLHHHILPAWYQETPEKNHSYSVLLDSGRVQEFIRKYHINLVIHGHNHASQFSKITIPSVENSEESEYSYHIIGMGSSGVLCESNVIGVLDFGTLGHIRYSNIQINPLGKENLMRQNYTFSLQ